MDVAVFFKIKRFHADARAPPESSFLRTQESSDFALLQARIKRFHADARVHFFWKGSKETNQRKRLSPTQRIRDQQACRNFRTRHPWLGPKTAGIHARRPPGIRMLYVVALLSKAKQGKAQSPKPKAQSPKPKAQSPKPKAQSQQLADRWIGRRATQATVNTSHDVARPHYRHPGESRDPFGSSCRKATSTRVPALAGSTRAYARHCQPDAPRM